MTARKRTQTVRLQDVCDRTGLSLYTVSLALRGEKGVALETRERVLAAARELGYDVRQMRGARQAGGMPSRARPRVRGAPHDLTGQDGAAQAVRLARRRLAIAYPAARGIESIEREVNTRLYLRGIQRAAQALAVDLVFLPSLEDERDPLAHFVLGDAHRDERADGVVLLGFGDESPTVRRALSLRPAAPQGQWERAARVVMLNRFAPPVPCSWISVDHTAAAARLIEHFFERGYGRVAFVSERYDRTWQRQRHQEVVTRTPTQNWKLLAEAGKVRKSELLSPYFAKFDDQTLCPASVDVLEGKRTLREMVSDLKPKLQNILDGKEG